jgi:hypothetical protein
VVGYLLSEGLLVVFREFERATSGGRLKTRASRYRAESMDSVKLLDHSVNGKRTERREPAAAAASYSASSDSSTCGGCSPEDYTMAI